MDPDATLALIREILSADQWKVEESDLDQLFSLVEALDDWLSRGGFYPRDWEAHRP